MNEELLAKFNTGKHTEGGNGNREPERDTETLSKHAGKGFRKTKVQLELRMGSLASDIKVNKIGFFTYTGCGKG